MRRYVRSDQQECPICTNSYPNQNFIEFSPACRHSFCESCTRYHIATQLQLFKTIQCLHYGCPEWLSEDSRLFRQELLLYEKQKYYKILIRQKVNRRDNQRHCPKENCQGYIITDQRPAICVLCQTEYCLGCMAPKHKGTCDDYGAQMIMKGGDTQRCKCGAVIQRISGCPHMTCTNCRRQFCDICGAKYQNGHICNPNDRRDRRSPKRINPYATQPSATALRIDHQVEPPIRRGAPRDPPREQPRIQGLCTRILVGLITLMGYIVLFFPIDLLLCSGLAILLLLWILKDCLLGVFYRPFVQLKAKVDQQPHRCRKLDYIVFFVIIYPFILLPCMFLEITQNAPQFFDLFQGVFCRFYRKVILQRNI